MGVGRNPHPPPPPPEKKAPIGPDRRCRSDIAQSRCLSSRSIRSKGSNPPARPILDRASAGGARIIDGLLPGCLPLRSRCPLASHCGNKRLAISKKIGPPKKYSVLIRLCMILILKKVEAENKKLYHNLTIGFGTEHHDCRQNEHVTKVKRSNTAN